MIRTHAPLENISKFEGRRYRPDESLEWIKTFTYEMKGMCKPQNDWCEPFSLSLGEGGQELVSTVVEENAADTEVA